MVRLNKHSLDEKQEQQLRSQLVDIMNNSASGNIFSELLGEEEELMIAKRLAIIILLIEDISMYRISRVLKLSPTTVEKVREQLLLGRYEQLLKVLGKSKRNYFAFLDTLDSILHLGGILPHYNGLDRYKWMDRSDK